MCIWSAQTRMEQVAVTSSRLAFILQKQDRFILTAKEEKALNSSEKRYDRTHKRSLSVISVYWTVWERDQVKNM